MNELQALADAGDEFSGDIISMRKDIEVYQTGIAAQRLRLHDSETISSRRMEEIEESTGRTVESLSAKHARLLETIEETRSKMESEIEAIKTQHDSDLGEMETLLSFYLT